MKNDAESDLLAVVAAQKIRMDKRRYDKPSKDDIETLAEAKRVQDDEDRAEAVRKLAREKKKAAPKADVFAGEGSIAGKMRERRMAVESGDLEGSRDISIK